MKQPIETPDRIPEPPLNEPKIISCLFVTGAAAEITQHTVRIIGWLNVPDLGGETTERRIVVRFAMPISAARKLTRELSAALR